MEELEPQQNEEGAGVDDIVIAALEQALEYARSKRAESVMAPQPSAPEAPPPGAEDAEMAELEQMLAEPGAPKPDDEDEERK